jgi:adenylate cyclase
MSAKLIVHTTGEATRTVALRAICTIGRGPDNDLVLEDPRVSRNHALLRQSGDGGYYVVDLGSSNGTFLNGSLVTVPVALKSGDEIQVGDHRLGFTASSATGGQTIPRDLGTTMGTMAGMKCETIGILVVDIRNYTRLAEAVPPGELSQWVGSWFKEAGRIIERHGGTIDKFIGDAVMAYWRRQGGADPKYVNGPIRVASELVAFARGYHEKLIAKYSTLGFAIGCGIHIGEAMLGNVGSVARRDFTAIGDCVNVAFRIESLCKELGRPILVSREASEKAGADFDFEDLGPQRVKGKSEAIHVFALSE